MLHVRDLLLCHWSKTGFDLRRRLLTSFCMSLRMRSHMMRCGPSHTTIRTCCFEVDVPWGRILMPALMLAEHPKLRKDPADKPGELEPLPTNEVLTENLHEPATRLHNAGNEIPDQSPDPDDLPEADMDRPL